MALVEGLLAAGIVAAVLSLLSSPLIYRGLRHRSRYRAVRETPVETPATATPGETALVTGTARGRDYGRGLVTGPVSGDPAILAAWGIHSLRSYGPFWSRRVWAQEALAVDTEGFELRDGDRRVVVPDWSRRERVEDTDRLQMTGVGIMPVEGFDIGDLWVEIDAFDAETQVPPDETPDERLRDLESAAGLDPAEPQIRLLSRLPFRLRTPDGTRRYQEVAVEEGDQVTVWGTVRHPDGGDGPARIEAPDDGSPLVATLDPEALERRYRRSYWQSVYGPLLLAVAVAAVVGVGVAL